MKKFIRSRALAVAAIGAAMAFTSCTYPYYGSAGGSYSSGGYNEGYGYGYGYGGSSFSTTMFVSTGNPRWGYDPYCYAYYDYSRRCYYDPYLNGYYPVGYRPPVMIGCPHPYGYRRSYCPPPRYVKNVTVVNYRNREQAYRGTNYDWARQVRQKPVNQGSANQGSNRGRTNSDWQRQPDRRTYDSRPQTGQQNSFWGSGNRGNTRQEARPQSSSNRGGRVPSAYNTPVTRESGRQEARRAENIRQQQGRQQSVSRQPQPNQRQRVQQAPNPSRGREAAPPRQQSQPRGEQQQRGRTEEDRGRGNSRGVRGLGQG